VEYNKRGFFPLWDTTENNLKMANKFFSITGNLSCVISYTTTESYTVYCIPEKSSTLYPTTSQVLFHFIPQWKIFPSIVGYNGRGFFPIWDTTEEVFSVVGYNGKKLYKAE
jgi:hypothetical protein